MGRNNLLDNLEAVAETLEELWCSYNMIGNLNGAKSLTKLKVLHMSNNNIKLMDEIDKLSELAALEDVLFINNPFRESMDVAEYRIEIIKRLPNVKKIDGVPVDVDEKEAAGVLWGRRGRDAEPVNELYNNITPILRLHVPHTQWSDHHLAAWTPLHAEDAVQDASESKNPRAGQAPGISGSRQRGERERAPDPCRGKDRSRVIHAVLSQSQYHIDLCVGNAGSVAGFCPMTQ